MKYEKDVRVEDLDENLQEISKTIGLDNTIKLVKMLSGIAIYFPKYERVTLKARDRAIKKEFTGANHKELAKKYGMTQRSIRNILENQAVL